MTVEQGARFRARRPLRTTCLISWAAPFTSGHDAILPEGEIITVQSTPPPGASAVYCAPLRYDALHGYFVDEGTRAARRYTGYHLAIDLVRLRESCEPVDETAAPATASAAHEDPWAGAPGPATVSAVIGCLLGTAVGDALGLPYEGMSRLRAQRLAGSLDRHRFLPGRGMVSDDTEHTCMVAQSLIESAGDDARFLGALARRLRWWLLALPAGTGLATLRAGVKLLIGVPPAASGVWSAGNGAAMRAPVIGAAYGHDRERLIRLVRASTRLTHRDPRAEHGALRRVLPQVLEAAWPVTDQTKQQVHGAGLGVAARLPPGDGVLPKPEQPRELALCHLQTLANRPDLVGGEQPIFPAIDRERPLLEVTLVIEPEHDLGAPGAREMPCRRDADLFPVHRQSQSSGPLSHPGPASGTRVIREDSGAPGPSRLGRHPSCHRHPRGTRSPRSPREARASRTPPRQPLTA